MWAGSSATISSAGPIRTDPAQQVSFGTSGHRGTPCAARSPRRTSWRSRRRSANTGRARDRRPALHGQGHARAVRAGAADRARSARGQRGRDHHSAATTASRRRRSISHAILVYNRGPQRSLADGDRHHALAQSAGGRRLQVQPAQRRAGRHRRHGVDPGPRQRAASATATRASSGCRCAPRVQQQRRTHQDDLISPYVDDLTQRHRHGCDPRRRWKLASIRSAARAPGYWEPIRPSSTGWTSR